MRTSASRWSTSASRRADLLPDESARANVYARMQTERERDAAEFRALGQEQAQRIRAEADREATVIRAEAQRQAEILRGEGRGRSARRSSTTPSARTRASSISTARCRPTRPRSGARTRCRSAGPTSSSTSSTRFGRSAEQGVPARERGRRLPATRRDAAAIAGAVP